MGRWFGYRDGYRDLCRVFLSEEAEGWYRHVADATNELKRDFARMRRQRATPEEFGLRVRTHPDTLLITARNKMASGVDVVGEVRDISLAGRLIETARLYADQSRNEDNFKIIDRFLSDLVKAKGRQERSPNGRAALWHDVPVEIVARLLGEFLVHPLNHDFQGDAIAKSIADDPQLAFWSVAVPTEGTLDVIDPPLSIDLPVKAKKRRVLLRQKPPQSLLVSGKGAIVGGPEDVVHGLSLDEAEVVRSFEKKANPDKDVP